MQRESNDSQAALPVEAAYAPPIDRVPAANGRTVSPPHWLGLAATMLVLGFFAPIVSLIVGGVAHSDLVGWSVFALLVTLAVSRLGVAFRRATRTTTDRLSPASAIGHVFVCSLFYVLGTGAVFFFGSFFVRGRHIRRRGRSFLPPVTGNGAWAQVPSESTCPPELRRDLAAEWRETARTEHASVAAFSHLSVNLIALGAPPSLIRAAHADALDEIRHTELCFSIARGLDGAAQGPGPFHDAQFGPRLPRVRSIALAKLAVDSLLDGALHEGISVRLLSATLARCEDPSIREMVREILRDEGRHAAHGWRVVDWCVRQGGEVVTCALLGAIRFIPESAPEGHGPAAHDGSLERFGIPGTAMEARERLRGRSDVVRRVRAMAERSPMARLMAA